MVDHVAATSVSEMRDGCSWQGSWLQNIITKHSRINMCTPKQCMQATALVLQALMILHSPNVKPVTHRQQRNMHVTASDLQTLHCH
jgi:hypothetical protein